MRLKIAILPLAMKDLSRAAKWYDRRSPGYGRKLVVQFDVALAAAAQNPKRYREVASGVRRVLMRDFPYAIFFVLEDEALLVFACLHQRRNPSVWKRRSSKVR